MRGFGDRSSILLPGANPIFRQPSGSGFQYPWPLNTAGFGRFTGDTSAAGHLCEVQSSYAIEPGTGKLAIYFSMKNTGPPAATFTVVSNQYRPWDQGYPTAAGATSSDYFNAIAYDNGWYDFTVTLTSDSSWSRRFAGDLETEQPASPVDEPQQGFPCVERGTSGPVRSIRCGSQGLRKSARSAYALLIDAACWHLNVMKHH